MLRPPRIAYATHKAGAKSRGIEFDFTFEEWWAIWEPHYARRGVASDSMQMCRTRDEGAYRPGNVRIDTHANNIAEFKVTRFRREIVRDFGTSSGHDWLEQQNAPFANYFEQRITAERAAERGELIDD